MMKKHYISPTTEEVRQIHQGRLLDTIQVGSNTNSGEAASPEMLSYDEAF